VFHVGPVGSGATIKLAVNAVIYGLCEALAEGLVLAERAGVERTTAYEIFASSAVAAPFVHYRRQEFERPGEPPVAFRLALAKKDLDLILELSERLQSPMPQAAANIGVLEAAMSGGYADHDVSAVAEYLRRGPRRD
jgi:3-hydroxyisobutyrate dehydrogenase-like beta-hydroxyacid dehydrogenase